MRRPGGWCGRLLGLEGLAGAGRRPPLPPPLAAPRAGESNPPLSPAQAPAGLPAAAAPPAAAAAAAGMAALEARPPVSLVHSLARGAGACRVPLPCTWTCCLRCEATGGGGCTPTASPSDLSNPPPLGTHAPHPHRSLHRLPVLHRHRRAGRAGRRRRERRRRLLLWCGWLAARLRATSGLSVSACDPAAQSEHACRASLHAPPAIACLAAAEHRQPSPPPARLPPTPRRRLLPWLPGAPCCPCRGGRQRWRRPRWRAPPLGLVRIRPLEAHLLWLVRRLRLPADRRRL